MKENEIGEIKLHTFLTSSLDGGLWQDEQATLFPGKYSPVLTEKEAGRILEPVCAWC
jgi:hypothetical protein